jgi:hypothetical protein
MADPVKFKISPTVAAFVRPGVPVNQKLAGLKAASSLEAFDRVTLVYCLMRDADAEVKTSAGSMFSELPEDVILQYVDSPDGHPSVLDSLAKGHHAKPWVAQALLGNDLLSDPARAFLQGRTTVPAPVVAQAIVAVAELGAEQEAADSDVSDESANDDPDEASDDSEVETAEIDEDDEKFMSKYKVAMVMGISEKIKMALSGDKEWRSILIKDSNKLVSGSVIKNPRITDGEILTILKVGVQNDEIIRLICANKEWTKNYLIRKALIDCPKTPLPNSLRYLASLNEKDISSYAKSKNISSVLSTQAKRLLLAKKR